MSDFDFDIETMQEEGNPMLAYVDIVFVIDITAGMNLIIDKIKSFATRIYDTLSTATKEENCSLEQLRVKIIVQALTKPQLKNQISSICPRTILSLEILLILWRLQEVATFPSQALKHWHWQ